jgi:hypothetical protein
MLSPYDYLVGAISRLLIERRASSQPLVRFTPFMVSCPNFDMVDTDLNEIATTDTFAYD